MEGTRPQAVPPNLPALAELDRILTFILEAREWTLAEHWTYNPTPDQQRFIRIVADMWARFIDHTSSSSWNPITTLRITATAAGTATTAAAMAITAGAERASGEGSSCGCLSCWA